jgi:proton glutamate symport protein
MFKKVKLHWLILLGMVLGVLFGWLLPNQVKYIEWTGTVFIRLLKMIVVPLVFTSLVSGVANMGSSENLGRLGLKTISYYLTSSIFAILTGLFLVNIMHPGVPGSVDLPQNNEPVLQIKPLSQTLLDIIPTNIFQAFSSDDMLGVIFFAILVGFFITQLPKEKSKTLESFFSAGFELMMKITLFIIRFAPVGVMGIIAGVIAQQENLGNLVATLWKYIQTVVLGLSFHFFITLPLFLLLIGRIHPIRHFKAMATPLLTAFSTASSNATLPLTLEHIERKSNVSNKISSFTLPLGATINMDGTALYEVVVAGFVAQLYGIDLSLDQQFILVATALLASIGTAAVPMASLVTMTIIFSALNLPLEAIAIVLPIDRLLDMMRTTTNVWSDTCGAVIIAKSEGEAIYQQTEN